MNINRVSDALPLADRHKTPLIFYPYALIYSFDFKLQLDSHNFIPSASL